MLRWVHFAQLLLRNPCWPAWAAADFYWQCRDSGSPLVYDFFCQTPAKRRPEKEIDFYPIMVDFGAALQEFHIGMGSMAVPGVVAGIFEIHHDLGRMPIGDIMAPAVELARSGVEVNSFNHYIIRILQPIVGATRGFLQPVRIPPGTPAS